VAGSCEYGDEPSGSGARELVINIDTPFLEVRTESIYNNGVGCVRFQVLMAASMKFRIFWDVLL
jgi:hypothetical protein